MLNTVQLFLIEKKMDFYIWSKYKKINILIAF